MKKLTRTRTPLKVVPKPRTYQDVIKDMDKLIKELEEMSNEK